MEKFISSVRTFMSDEEGITAIEYAIMAALIAAALVTAVDTLGGGINAGFAAIAAMLV